jgi:hypothetical protein
MREKKIRTATGTMKKNNPSKVSTITKSTKNPYGSDPNNSSGLSWDRDGKADGGDGKVEGVNGGYTYYPCNQASQLPDLTFPIILTTQSHMQAPAEGSKEMLQFVSNSQRGIFTNNYICYALYRQISFEDEDSTTNDDDANGTEGTKAVGTQQPQPRPPGSSNISPDSNENLTHPNGPAPSQPLPQPPKTLPTPNSLIKPSLITDLKKTPITRKMFESSSDDE